MFWDARVERDECPYAFLVRKGDASRYVLRKGIMRMPLGVSLEKGRRVYDPFAS